MMKTRSEISKANRKKGKYYEKQTSDFWSKNQGVRVMPTPGSGSIKDLPGDLLVLGDCVLKEFIVDVKAERGVLSKKSLDYYKKNDEDAGLKSSFLEIYDFDEDRMHPIPYILIKRNYFAKILEELNGYRKEDI